jgi:hypothetical protein
VSGGQTSPRTWIFPPGIILALYVVTAAYVAVAGTLDIYLLGIAPRGTASRIGIRSLEINILWHLLCMCIGWLRRVRNMLASPDARVWPLSLPLVATGLASSACYAWSVADVWSGMAAGPSGLTVVIIAASVIMAAAFLGGGAAYSVHFQARYWKSRVDPSRICPCCDYNLHGNLSGVCPECGTPIEHNASIPREFYTGWCRWMFPELAAFPTAGQRYEAWRSAVSAERNIRFYSIAVSIIAAVIVCASIGRRHPWFERHWWQVLVAIVLIESALFWTFCQRIRRRLRTLCSARPKLISPSASRTD